MSDDDKGMGRRSMLMVVGVSALLVIAVAIASQMLGWWKPGNQKNTAPVSALAGPEVRAYFGDLKDGSKLDRWTLVRVYDIHAGGIPVMMATQDGRQYQVDLLRRDPAGPKPVAETTELSLFLANGVMDDGGARTPEEQGLGILQLAAALTTRENSGVKPPKLSTLKERLVAFPDRQFAISREQ